MPEEAVVTRAPAGRERERSVVTGVGVLLLLLWLGFAVHRSPSFPGSLAGTVLAVSGATLLVLPSLAYAAVKRGRPLKRWITARMPLPRWLAWHVYTGIMGAVLALLHSAHRFDSTLGIALTATMLLAVFSGYLGRHFLRYVSVEVSEKQQLLDQLIAAYNHIAGETAAQPVRLAVLAVSSSRWSRLHQRVMSTGRAAENHLLQQAHHAVQVADAIADLEYSIRAHQVLKRRSRVWLLVHIVTSIAFYVLLALHVWAAFYFGLRWLA